MFTSTYHQLEKTSGHIILSSSKSLITAIPSTSAAESLLTPNVFFFPPSTTSNPVSWKCAHRPHPSFLAATTFISLSSMNKHFVVSEMLAILIAYRNGERGSVSRSRESGVNGYVMKELWFWLASKVWLLVIAVDESFYLILDIQDLEHSIGMLVCLSGLAPALDLQDIRSCMHLSGPKRVPLSCLCLLTVSSTLGPA